MSRNTSGKSKDRKPNFKYTTIRVCGVTVSKQYNIICQLTPNHKHTSHAGIATTDLEVYLLMRQANHVYIQLEDGTWHVVEDLTG